MYSIPGKALLVLLVVVIMLLLFLFFYSGIFWGGYFFFKVKLNIAITKCVFRNIFLSIHDQFTYFSNPESTLFLFIVVVVFITPTTPKLT